MSRMWPSLSAMPTNAETKLLATDHEIHCVLGPPVSAYLSQRTAPSWRTSSAAVSVTVKKSSRDFVTPSKS